MVLPVRKPAPEFSGTAVVNKEFIKINLSDYRGKYILLFFYELDFTSLSRSEILAFSNRAEEFRKIGCEVIACSTDSQYCHYIWSDTRLDEGGIGTVNIPLLSDLSRRIAYAYDVLDQDCGTSFHGFFVIDPLQYLRHISYNCPDVGVSVEEALRVVQAIKHTDEHGEVCPANWKPGDKAIIPDTEKSKEYFKDFKDV